MIVHAWSKNWFKNWPLLGLLCGIVFIGFAAIFTRLADCNPISAAFWRSALALPVFLFMVHKFSSKKSHIQPLSFFTTLQLLLIGMLFGLDIAIWNAAIDHTAIANVAFLSNTTALFMILLTWVFSGQLLHTRRIWLGLSLTLSGAALISLGVTTPEINWLGDSLALLSALLFALYIMLITHFRQKINLWIILLFSDLGACLILGISSVGFEESLLISDLNTLFWIIVLSLVSQALGQGLVTTSLKYFSPDFSALMLTLTPVVCITAAWFIFQEPLSMLQGIGIILMIWGIYLAKNLSHNLSSG